MASDSSTDLSAVACVAVALYIEWGVVHIVAGLSFLYYAWGKNDGSGLNEMHTKMALPNMSEGDKAVFAGCQFPRYANRIYIHHGMNLFWAGVWSFLIAYVVCHPSMPLSQYSTGALLYKLCMNCLSSVLLKGLVCLAKRT